MTRFALCLLSSLFCLLHASASTVSGTITDTQKQPVAFCSVYLKGTTIGTTANIDGKYSLEVAAGSFEIVFRSIGFRLYSKKITIGKDEHPVLDVMLEPEIYQLKEAVINASAEDPAYEIIRQAIKKRKFYLNQVSSFSCKAYVKSTQKLLSYPKKFMGQDVDLGDVVDTATRIFYLSESVSNLHFRKPDEFKEEMISSKVSGSSRSFSFNQANDMFFSFYENLVTVGGLTQRGIVSPVSATAMMYYDYKLEGTFVENGETINRIKVIPKRRFDPVFTGTIYIMNDSWRIHSLDLFISKDQQIEFVDTFRFKQTYVSVEKDVWALLNTQFEFEFGAFGFHGKGVILGIMSNYNIHPDFPPRFFNAEVMKVNRDANKKDSVYWKETRPMVLTGEEATDYVKRDSTSVIYESKAYKDSMDKKDNKFSISKFIIAGYDYQNSYKHSYLTFSGMLQNVQFNTVEGLNVSLFSRFNKRKSDEDRRRFSLTGSARYGLSNHHFNGNASFMNRYNPRRFANYSISAGTDIIKFNDNNPISGLINSAYSLFTVKNYMKIYEKQFVSVGHRSELFNGVALQVGGEYANRLPLVNTSDYSFNNKTSNVYTSNDPLNSGTDSLHFNSNQSFTFDAKLRIRIKQKYIDRPEGKFITGSKYPELSIGYFTAVPSVFGSDADYNIVSTSVSDNIRLGLFGRVRYEATYGKFFSTHKMEFMDYHHFNGNRTIISTFGLNDFGLLDYYKYSTNANYIEAHGEYNFEGFILNKIPLLRRLKLNEIVGVHYFHTTTVKNYFETSFGIEKLRLLRADFILSFLDGKKVATGFVFGLKINVSNGGVRLE